MESSDAITATRKCPACLRGAAAAAGQSWTRSKSPRGHGPGLPLFPMLHFSWGWGRKERKAERAGGSRAGGEASGRTMGFVKSLSGQSGQVQWLQATSTARKMWPRNFSPTIPLVFLCGNLELQTHSFHKQHPQRLKAHWPELGKPAGHAPWGPAPIAPLPEDWA